MILKGIPHLNKRSDAYVLLAFKLSPPALVGAYIWAGIFWFGVEEPATLTVLSPFNCWLVVTPRGKCLISRVCMN